MNWKIRMQNGRFLMGLVGLLGLVSVYVAGQCGYTFDYEPIQTMLAMLLSLLAGVGIISDPTTPGVSDSLITMQKTNINQTSQDVINLQNLSKILATTAPVIAPAPETENEVK